MEQTNRTILFEEINPNKNNLLTLVNETGKRESLTDDEVLKIHQYLEVRSFQEFVEKFTPEVYMLLDTNNRKVIFSRECTNNAQQSFRLDQDDSLFDRLIHLMEAKEKKKYVLTNFSDLLENMFPIENMELFFHERNNIIRKIVKQSNTDIANMDMSIKELIRKYDNGILLINAFLKEVTNYLSCMDKEIRSDRGITDDEGKMQIQVIKTSTRYQNELLAIETTNIVEYEELITKYWVDSAQTIHINHMELFKDLLMLPILFANKDYRTIQKKYTDYCDLYEEIIKRFWVTAKPLIETMLGIKKYFEQYQNIVGMHPSLIICNFQVSDITTPLNREKLEIYLRSVNAKMFYQNTIWYSIIPNIASIDYTNGNIIRERFKAKREEIPYHRNDMESICSLLEITAKYKIQSFLSLALTEENTFTAFSKMGIDGINDSFGALERLAGKDYIIPCFPNFMVFSAEDACLYIGQKLEFDDLTEQIVNHEERKVWLDELGIEASYVASGLVAACQCPQYLRVHYKRGINEELPGVAYRFIEDGHNLITNSNMFSEIIEVSKEHTEDAIRRSRGILFGSQNGRMTILTDRVFSYSNGNPLLISMVQTINYIERVIRYETQDFKKNLIHQFFQRRPGSTISKWHMDENSKINAILKDNERLEYTVDDTDNECILSIYFNNSDLLKSQKVPMFIE